MSSIFLRDPASNHLISHQELKNEAILKAESFSVSLLAFRVNEDLDGWLRRDNDLLLLTRTSIGEAPRVRRVHFYEEEVAEGRFIDNIFAENIHVEEDFSDTDRVYIAFELYEVDRDDGDRAAIVSAFSGLAQTAGAAFPVTVPYVFGATVVAKAIEKLVSTFEKDDPIIIEEISLYPGKKRFGRAPLQEGTYVQFSGDVEPKDWTLQDNGRVQDAAGADVPHSYLLFQVSKQGILSPGFVENQRIAKLLEQIEQGNSNTARRTIEFLQDTLADYSNFKKLKRYQGLKSRGLENLSEAEKALLNEISQISDLQPFLPPA